MSNEGQAEEQAISLEKPGNVPMSKARLSFAGNSADIMRYFGFHKIALETRPLKDRLDIVDKAVYVLVASLWEAYCEDLAAEAAEILVEKSPRWESIPAPLVKTVTKELRALNSDSALWALAGDGWRNYLRDRLDLISYQRAFKFASPRSDSVDRLFRESLGIGKISESWHADPAAVSTLCDQLDHHVLRRNQIVHEYRAGRMVNKRNVKSFYALVNRLTAKTDGAVDELLVSATGKSHWTTPADGLKRSKQRRLARHIAAQGSQEFAGIRS